MLKNQTDSIHQSLMGCISLQQEDIPRILLTISTPHGGQTRHAKGPAHANI